MFHCLFRPKRAVVVPQSMTPDKCKPDSRVAVRGATAATTTMTRHILDPRANPITPKNDIMGVRVALAVKVPTAGIGVEQEVAYHKSLKTMDME